MRKTVEPRIGEEDWREVLVFSTVGFGFELLQDQSFGAAVGQVVTGLMLRLRSCLKLKKVNRWSVRCAELTHEIVRIVEGWVVEECEAAAGRHLDRSLRRVRERAGRR
jgi:hypothetical protein